MGSLLWFGLLLLSGNVVFLNGQCNSDSNLLSSVVDAIRGSHFESVKCPVERFDSLIPDIVRTTYDKTEKNFDVIISFARALKKITPTLRALKTLNEEMKANGHKNPTNLIILANTIQTEVVRQSNAASEILLEANNIIDELVVTIRAVATKFFIDAITANDYKTRDDVHNLANGIYSFRHDLSDQVIEGLIDGTYGKVDTDTIMANIVSHGTAQGLWGLNAVFGKLKDDGKINSPSVGLLASYLRQLEARADYASISNRRKDIAVKTMQGIPTCTRNLYSNTGKVCLWNKAKASYLLAADASYNFNTDRRNIFTYSTPLDDIPSGARWKLHWNDNKFLLESNAYPTEYMYVAYIHYENKDAIQHVFNWIIGNNTDPESEFTIENDGDYCRLKSAHFKQYLYASDIQYPEQPKYSYVFSWTAGTSDGPGFLWQVRSC